MDSKTLLRRVQGTPVGIVPKKRALSSIPGEWSSPFEGKGFEVRRFREYAIGDNPRHIHPATSARRNAPTVIERVALRDVQVMVVLDGSPSMALRDKFSAQIICAAHVLYSAWKSETTFGLAIRRGDHVESLGLGVGARQFHRLYANLFRILENERPTTRTKTVRLRSALPANAVLIFCSDFLDEDGELVKFQSIWRSVRRYDFVPVIVQDDLEYTFPDLHSGTCITAESTGTPGREEIWVSPQKARRLRKLHSERLDTLEAELERRGLRYLHLDTANVEEIGSRLARFFRKRRAR